MIHSLFEEQVERSPDRIAAVFDESVLTYRELNLRADRLAQQLRGFGVKPGALVGLFIDRSLELVIGMLAILKAGGAYVPVDPSHPSSRMALVLNDAQPSVLLTTSQLRAKLPPHKSREVMVEAALSTGKGDRSHSALTHGGNPSDLAYVIYTSGSTGTPKGVEVEHGSVLNMLASMQRQPGFGPGDTMLAITTVAFDISVLEIFLPLVSGGRVVIAPVHSTVDAEALIRLIDSSGANVLQATPSSLRMLLDAGWTGAPQLKLLCGGESWTENLAKELLARCGSLWNMYGPTETTVWSSVLRVEAGRKVVIGPPIAKTKFYVLDAARQLLPVGVTGELYIGGAGLARGYAHQPELTRERFLKDPFVAEPGARMYRTGDLVRRLADGNLDFLGRIDHQVKIRGYRVELGEIETALKQQSGVKDCIVVASADAEGQHRLVAYIIPDASKSVLVSELRFALSELLPAYMVPAAFVALSSFPLTPSGKIDRKALPTANSAALPVIDSPTPGTPTQEKVASVWRDLLKIEKVGIRDNFFGIGGNSLLATRVIGKINATTKAKLRIADIFLMPTVELLATAIERGLDATLDGNNVIQLQNGHSGLPLYILGAGLAEHKIAKFIGEDRAVFAIHTSTPRELLQAIAAGDRTNIPKVEQLGALYGKIIRAHAGKSRCVIAGYSFMGKVAFEAARTHLSEGGELAFVALIDAFAWSAQTRASARRSWHWIWRRFEANDCSQSPLVYRLLELIANSCRLCLWLITQLPLVIKSRLPSADLSGMADSVGTPIENSVYQNLVRLIGESFSPRPLYARGVLFKAEFPAEALFPGHDVGNGWGKLFSDGLEIIQETGNHLTMLLEPNVTALGQHLHDALDCEPDRLLERSDIVRQQKSHG